MKGIYEVREVVIGEGMPKVCAPLTGVNETELMEESARIRESKADMVEWRVDFFEDVFSAKAVLDTLKVLRKAVGERPILFSFRTLEEGGEREISSEAYLALNTAAISSGLIDLVDIELFKGNEVVSELIGVAKEHKVITVISNHDFNKTPRYDELIQRVETAIRLGGDIPKLALMPTKEDDVLTIFQANLALKKAHPNHPMILIAMGPLGVISRISGEVFGSAITFASVTRTSAPGQLTVDQVKKIMNGIHSAR
jgi:3-dehydroquinate dehydratase-1